MLKNSGFFIFCNMRVIEVGDVPFQVSFLLFFKGIMTTPFGFVCCIADSCIDTFYLLRRKKSEKCRKFLYWQNL